MPTRNDSLVTKSYRFAKNDARFKIVQKGEYSVQLKSVLKQSNGRDQTEKSIISRENPRKQVNFSILEEGSQIPREKSISPKKTKGGLFMSEIKERSSFS